MQIPVRNAEILAAMLEAGYLSSTTYLELTRARGFALLEDKAVDSKLALRNCSYQATVGLILRNLAARPRLIEAFEVLLVQGPPPEVEFVPRYSSHSLRPHKAEDPESPFAEMIKLRPHEELYGELRVSGMATSKLEGRVKVVITAFFTDQTNAELALVLEVVEGIRGAARPAAR